MGQEANLALNLMAGWKMAIFVTVKGYIECCFKSLLNSNRSRKIDFFDIKIF